MHILFIFLLLCIPSHILSAASAGVPWERFNHGKFIFNCMEVMESINKKVTEKRKALESTTELQNKTDKSNPEKELVKILTQINNEEITINQAHKKYGIPIDKITEGLVEKFGSKQFQLKKRFLKNTRTTFKQDLKAIDDPNSPVRIAWVAAKYNIEACEITQALNKPKKSIKKKSSEEPNKPPQRLARLALKELTKK